ncbi:MAG: hypothetical protein WD063_08530 [Pirellulales bacterium]
MTQITKESQPRFFAGSGTVGLTEVPLSPINLPINKFVTIKAGDNNNFILVGRRNSASEGFPLLAGEQSPPIYVETTDAIGVVGLGADQAFSWVAT